MSETIDNIVEDIIICKKDINIAVDRIEIYLETIRECLQPVTTSLHDFATTNNDELRVVVKKDILNATKIIRKIEAKMNSYEELINISRNELERIVEEKL